MGKPNVLCAQISGPAYGFGALRAAIAVLSLRNNPAVDGCMCLLTWAHPSGRRILVERRFDEEECRCAV